MDFLSRLFVAPLTVSFVMPLAVLLSWAIATVPAAVATAPGVQPTDSSLTASSSVPRWLPPVESPLRVSGPYLAPPTPYASGHRGVDMPAAPGNRVHAPVSGTVSFVGQVVDRGVISIKVDDSTTVSLEPVDMQGLELREGSAVLRGQELGVVSSGGHCYAECLHLGVRVDGEYVNPMRFFFRKAVLLPW